VDIMGMSVVEVLPLLLLFVALVALLVIYFGVVNVVRPLQELDRRAQRVAWGDFDAVKQPVGGVQEMDDLRATLEQMAERIRAYQTGMHDYLSAITQAQEAERGRLAHELHDDTVQALIALKQRGQMARRALVATPESGQAPDLARAGERLDELTGLIDQELAALRRLIGDLRPIYLEDLGFVPALEMLCQQMEERHGLAVRMDVRGQTVRLAPDLELAAFRIVQAALSNVAAHAAARHVDVTVDFATDGLTLAVQDDGRGFTPPDQPADLVRSGHFGLMGMRERAMLYGGRLSIVSAPGQGTTISAWLPVH
jgi:signal transduction histidine kinase